MERNRIILILIAILSLHVAGKENTLSAGSDFQISIPSDWVEIPRGILDQYEVAVKELTGQNQTFEYGYQLAGSGNWLEHPYALVQIRRTGRIPEGELKKYKKIEKGFNEGVQILEESAGDILDDIKLGETVYEQDRHILWSAMTMNVANVGSVKGMVAMKLTEFGMIQFMGYAKEENFAQLEPVYRKMVHNLTVNPEDEYKPRWTDNAPGLSGINWGKALASGIVGALIAGVFGLFNLLRQKLFYRRSNPEL